MKVGKVIRKGSVLIVLAGAGILWFLLVSSPSSLIDRATRVADLPDGPYQWIDTNTLYYFTLIRKADHGPWSIMQRDIRTNQDTLLPCFTRKFSDYPGDPIFASFSPEGTRLAWQAGHSLYTTDIEGKGLQHWEVEKDTRDILQPVWQAGSSPVIAGITARTGHMDDIIGITFWYPDNSQAVHLEETPPAAETHSNYYQMPQLMPDGSIFTYGSCCEEGAVRTLILLTTGRKGSKRILKIHSPTGMKFVSNSEATEDPLVALAPNGDRIAWLCRTQPFVYPVNSFLHRIWSRLAVLPRRIYNIQVSHLDGSERSDLGQITVMGDGFYSLITDLRWLPDGRHLSFVYNQKTIYRVPVTP